MEPLDPNRPRKRTRALAGLMEASPAKRTRHCTTGDLQIREAMYRSQLVGLPDHGFVLAIDQTRPGDVRVSVADGRVIYHGIVNHRRHGIEAVITARMIAANVGTAPGVVISGGMAPGFARGHLLARALGGSGTEYRNLVPIPHQYSNIQQYQRVEKLILNHVLRHKAREQFDILGRDATLAEARAAVLDPDYVRLHQQGYYHTVRYVVTPRYNGGSDIFPDSLDFIAECQTCGAFTQRGRAIVSALRR